MCEYCNDTQKVKNKPCQHCVGDLKSDQPKIELMTLLQDKNFKEDLRNAFNHDGVTK